MEILGVTETVLDYLRTKIITGELAPGQKLNEMELSSGLKISRGPLREALRILEQEHLVVSLPRKGCYVAGISIEDFIELYEAREMLECYAIDLIGLRGKRELPEVEAALEVTADLPFPPDSDEQAKLDYLRAFADFHFKLVEAAENKRVTHFYRTIAFNLARYQFMYAYIPGLTRNSQKEHQRILDYIKTGKYEKAKRFLKSHIKAFVKLMESRVHAQNAEDGKISFRPASEY
ncbi:MAG: GntR family transcriptional regulator [Deltaproteobacteria bacterium]|nr:GntR family transcriptional regulator [Deltaproteobacteria bacterium]MBW1931112.1 GntR family transcriptional regulator [Deltaproteobacteria bacterium]MBW2025499.1 GntR family transcriptional regulator [Deltaproteobacteria bacterium]MBW2125297.1 GntR family transcriptional regulator [Deltaproteobacteria bacterium]